MAITLKSPLRARERILTFGVQGTGKSNNILSIARRCPNNHFYIVDNDVSPSYNRALDSEFSDLENVTVRETDPDDWKDGLEGAKELAKMAEYNDWVVFDSMTSPWTAVQSWFVENLHEEDEADYFMKVRQSALAAKEKGAKDKGALGALEGWMDWPVNNKEYFKLTKALFRTKGHLYMTAEMDKTGEKDDSEVKDLFGPFGVKPKGQKRLGYMPHSVLLLSKDRTGAFKMTTVKDRNREDQVGTVVGDFSKDYLQKVAGWKMEVVK